MGDTVDGRPLLAALEAQLSTLHRKDGAIEATPVEPAVMETHDEEINVEGLERPDRELLAEVRRCLTTEKVNFFSSWPH